MAFEVEASLPVGSAPRASPADSGWRRKIRLSGGPSVANQYSCHDNLHSRAIQSVQANKADRELKASVGKISIVAR